MYNQHYDPGGPFQKLVNFLAIVGLLTIFGFGMYCGMWVRDLLLLIQW